jgi:hypothetical protein
MAVRRLALLAGNALANGDLRRVQTALRSLHDMTASGGALDDKADAQRW